MRIWYCLEFLLWTIRKLLHKNAVNRTFEPFIRVPDLINRFDFMVHHAMFLANECSNVAKSFRDRKTYPFMCPAFFEYYENLPADLPLTFQGIYDARWPSTSVPRDVRKFHRTSEETSLLQARHARQQKCTNFRHHSSLILISTYFEH